MSFERSHRTANKFERAPSQTGEMHANPRPTQYKQTTLRSGSTCMYVLRSMDVCMHVYILHGQEVHFVAGLDAIIIPLGVRGGWYCCTW